MPRARLKRKFYFKIKKRNLLALVFLFIGIAIYAGFLFVDKKISPLLLNYAELETNKIASIVINKAISKQMAEDLSIDQLFIMDKNSEGEIRTIDFNPIIVNKMLSKLTNNVQLNLKYIEEGHIDLLELPDNILAEYDKEKLKKGIIYEIPTGVIFKNALLSNLGPKIPVKLNMVGEIISGVKTKVTNYGINNALIEVSVSMRVTAQVILPFTASRIRIENDVPVAMKLVQGNIPNYYFNGLEKNSATFSLPIITSENSQ